LSKRPDFPQAHPLGGPPGRAARHPRHRPGAATGISEKWPQGSPKGKCRRSPLSAAIDTGQRA
jgi:hypothetical protein